MELFSEALRHLDGLKDLASRYVADQELSRDASICDDALDNVINLRSFQCALLRLATSFSLGAPSSKRPVALKWIAYN